MISSVRKVLDARGRRFLPRISTIVGCMGSVMDTVNDVMCRFQFPVERFIRMGVEKGQLDGRMYGIIDRGEGSIARNVRGMNT